MNLVVNNLIYTYIIQVILMFMNILINSYLKNINTEKAILVAKQLCIEFSFEEMNHILPIVKSKWQDFLDENKKPVLLNYIANRTSPETSKKTDALVNKLLIILS